MKKTLCLLLVFLLTASLIPYSAFAESDSAEKFFVTEEKSLLAQKKIYGDYYPYIENGMIHIPGRMFDVVTDYSYDEYGNLTGENEHLVYDNANISLNYLTDAIYDESGNIKSAKRDAGSFDGAPKTDYLEFENGLLHSVKTTVPTLDTPLTEVEYTYDNDGQVTKETRKQLINFGQAVEESVYDFSKDGYCTDYKTIIGTSVRDIHFEYNENGRLTFLSTVLDNGSPSAYDVTYDETGLFVREMTVTGSDGKVQVFTYEYNDQGQLITRITMDGAVEDRLEFTYNNYGYISDITEIKWGYQQGSSHISYAETEDGVEARRDNNWGPAIFTGTTKIFYKDHKINESESYSTYEYYFDPVTLTYVDDRTYFDYDVFSILVEKKQEGISTSGSIEDYYPMLSSSYGGYEVPIPDGSKRPIRIILQQPMNFLSAVTDLLYDSEGNLAGEQSYFDGIRSYDIVKQVAGWSGSGNIIETDEYGRLSKIIGNAGTANEFTTEFIYPNDLNDRSSYKKIQNYGDQHIERELIIDDSRPSDLIKKTPEERRSSWEIEYDEDGLISKVTKMKQLDANGNPTETLYTYYYQPSDSGFLRYIGCSSIMGAVLEFDNNGYLKSYSLEPTGIGWVEFEYSSIS